MKSLVAGLLLIVVLMSFTAGSAGILKTLVIGILVGIAAPALLLWFLQDKGERSGCCLLLFIPVVSVILIGAVLVI